MKKVLIILAVFFGLSIATPAFAAIVVGTPTTGTISAPSSTFSITVSAGQNALLVEILGRECEGDLSGGTNSVKYDGLPMYFAIGEDDSDVASVCMFTLIDPPVGTHNIAVTSGASETWPIAAILMSGVNDSTNTSATGTPVTVAPNGTSMSVVASSNFTGDVVFDGAVAEGGSLSAVNGQTMIFNNLTGLDCGASCTVSAGYKSASGSATTMGYTMASNFSALGAIPFHATGGTQLPAYRSSSFNFGGSGTTVTCTAPSGIQNGDLLFTNVIGDELSPTAAPTITTLSGWTFIDSITEAVGSGAVNLRESYYYKIAASESGNYTWTISPSTFAAGILCSDYTGVNTSNPFQTDTLVTYSGSASPSASAIITTKNNELLITNFTSDASPTWTPPTGATERIDNSGIELNDMLQATAGNTGAQTATASGSGTGLAFMAAFNPISSGTTTIIPSFMTIKSAFIRIMGIFRIGS